MAVGDGEGERNIPSTSAIASIGTSMSSAGLEDTKECKHWSSSVLNSELRAYIEEDEEVGKRNKKKE